MSIGNAGPNKAIVRNISSITYPILRTIGTSFFTVWSSLDQVWDYIEMPRTVGIFFCDSVIVFISRMRDRLSDSDGRMSFMTDKA